MRVTRRSRSESLDRQEVLFSDIRLGEVLHERQQEALGEIAQYSADRLLNTSTDDLIAYFEKKHLPDPIRILEDEIRADYEEAKLERGGRSLYMSGTVIVLHVPFQGDPSLFRCVPSASNLSRPRGYITGNVLELLEYPANQDAQAVRQELDRRLEQIRKYVTWVASDLERFEQSLRDDARRQIEARRRKLLEAQGLAAAAGFPLRKRPDAPRTYVPSQLRRKLPPTPPPASTAPYVAEPTLEMERYEHILDIISKTASMLERSPQAFKGMNEEHLRDQFLVPLNSHYEGQVTGETFTFSGKTDILVRVGDKSVFVAECKIWQGPKRFSRAIDQLLGQASWRDTKTAILLFNRRRNFSAVLDKIPGVVREHSSYKRDTEYPHETGFRFVLGHRDDPNRELTLTVLAFEVPK